MQSTQVSNNTMAANAATVLVQRSGTYVGGAARIAAQAQLNGAGNIQQLPLLQQQNGRVPSSQAGRSNINIKNNMQ